MSSNTIHIPLNKFRISRRGRKLQIFDDQRMLVALPKDIPEKTWAEVLQKEENDLIIFDIREEIIEGALRIVYEHYMQKQSVYFTAHCAAQAWLKLIDWNFYRHDPGEDPTAYPPCFIPKRVESWIPDDMPEPSPKDTWSRHDLNVIEYTTDEGLQKWPSNHSLDLPVVEGIPSKYWFPGKINLSEVFKCGGQKKDPDDSKLSSDPSRISDDNLISESEVLQKVTDYNTDELTSKESTFSALKTTTPVAGSQHDAGDPAVSQMKPKKKHSVKRELNKVVSKTSGLARSKNTLPPLNVETSRSHISVISDCRLRNLRLDTHYEISPEKLDTPLGKIVKRK